MTMGTYIKQLRKEMGISQKELGESLNPSVKAAEETKILELVQKHFGKNAVRVLQMFGEINQTGQQKVLEDMSDMTQLPKYIQKDSSMLKNA